jgi:hypothetical protein
MKQSSLPPASSGSESALKTIAFAGLLAGLLDGAAASVQYFISTGNSPTRVFQYIASAVFGKSAFAGGLEMAGWGLLFHLLIAMGFAALFFLLYPLIFRPLKNKIAMGIVYGLMVWMIMNLLVVPLTKAPQGPFKLKGVLIGMSILILMVGIPVSLIISRYYTTKKPAPTGSQA